jgi:hypothetical protein
MPAAARHLARTATAVSCNHRRYIMPDTKGSVQLKLTPEQQEQIRQATGKSSDTLELSIMELEERITPGYRTGP